MTSTWTDLVPVWVEAADPVTSSGITAQLAGSSRLRLVAEEAVGENTVVVLAMDSGSSDAVLERARELAGAGCNRFVLVTAALDDEQLQTVVEIGICAVVERRDTTPAKLERLVLKALRGESELPTALLSRLFHRMSTMEHSASGPRQVPYASLTNRESQVLRLVADGLDTDEIAERLSYSSRTVKNVLHAVTTRFCLRNRSHAVAYAMREGLI